MNILALDTSTEYLTLALLLNEQVTGVDMHAGQSHSQKILPLLNNLLNEAKTELSNLDGIAFGAGPGSFTGLRIGCGVAQGLAFGVGLPVVGISTLMALAEGSGYENVIACLDARVGEVYHAAYSRDGSGWIEVSPPGLYKPDEVPRLEGSNWTGAGSGWSAYPASLEAIYRGQVVQIQKDAYPRARAIAELALPIFKAGGGLPAHEAAPVYLRNKVALKSAERGKMAGLK